MRIFSPSALSQSLWWSVVRAGAEANGAGFPLEPGDQSQSSSQERWPAKVVHHGTAPAATWIGWHRPVPPNPPSSPCCYQTHRPVPVATRPAIQSLLQPDPPFSRLTATYLRRWTVVEYNFRNHWTHRELVRLTWEARAQKRPDDALLRRDLTSPWRQRRGAGLVTADWWVFEEHNSYNCKLLDIAIRHTWIWDVSATPLGTHIIWRHSYTHLNSANADCRMRSAVTAFQWILWTYLSIPSIVFQYRIALQCRTRYVAQSFHAASFCVQ